MQIDTLTIATLLLVIATAVSVRWMAIDIGEKRKARLSFAAPVVKTNTWDSLVLEHTVINTGLGYLSLVSTTFQWWPVLAPERSRLEVSDQVLPIYLAPHEKKVVTFAVEASRLGAYRHNLFQDPLELITGRISYKVVGGDRRGDVYAYNLPVYRVSNVFCGAHESLAAQRSTAV